MSSDQTYLLVQPRWFEAHHNHSFLLILNFEVGKKFYSCSIHVLTADLLLFAMFSKQPSTFEKNFCNKV